MSSMQGKKIKVNCKGEMKVVILRQYNFVQLIQFLQESFELPQEQSTVLRYVDSDGEPVVVGSEEEFVCALEAGTVKFELVESAKPKPVPILAAHDSNLDQSLTLEEKRVRESPMAKGKTEQDVQTSGGATKPEGEPNYRLNPAALQKIFHKFMTTEACVLEIVDTVKVNCGRVIGGEFGLEDYADTLKDMESMLSDALDSNVYLVDVGSDEEAEGVTSSLKELEREARASAPVEANPKPAKKSKQRGVKESTDLDNMPVDRSISEAHAFPSSGGNLC